jgi:hypothetical protein
MIRTYRTVLSLVLSLVLVGCGSVQQSASRDARSGISADRIVVHELSFPIAGLSAYDVIAKSNPQWLRKRGSVSIEQSVPIKVYLNNASSAFGTVASLRRIDADIIDYIAHYSAREAQFRFGLNNAAGAIFIQTRTGPQIDRDTTGGDQ